MADFTDHKGVVDDAGKKWASKTYNELDQFMRADPALRKVVEVARLYADSAKNTIRNEEDAKKAGESTKADMVIWGQNLCVKDSICYYAKAYISHNARTTSTIEEGVLNQAQLLRADLPTLIGARAEVLVKFIIGWTYLNDNKHTQFQQAFRYLQKALNEVDAKDRQTILFWAAFSTINAGHYDLGLTWYDELVKRQIKANNRAGLATTYNNIGGIYDYRGEWDKALEFYHKSEKISIEVGDRAGLATTYRNIGLIERKRGRLQNAMEFYHKSEKILLEIGDRKGLASLYNSLAVIYDRTEKPKLARQYYQKSLQLDREIGNYVHETTVRFNLALFYSRKNRFDEAIAELQRCVEIDEMLNLPYKKEHLKWIEKFRQQARATSQK